MDVETYTTVSNNAALESGASDPLLLRSKKRPLHQDDPFFQEGTYEYKAAWMRLEVADAYFPDMGSPEDSKDSESSHRLYG
ncbi:hypothetical protein BGX28_009631, partial [Mortierella sp. GBA30]